MLLRTDAVTAESYIPVPVCRVKAADLTADVNSLVIQKAFLKNAHARRTVGLLAVHYTKIYNRLLMPQKAYVYPTPNNEYLWTSIDVETKST
jgi:hypothetical protein